MSWNAQSSWNSQWQQKGQQQQQQQPQLQQQQPQQWGQPAQQWNQGAQTQQWSQGAQTQAGEQLWQQKGAQKGAAAGNQAGEQTWQQKMAQKGGNQAGEQMWQQKGAQKSLPAAEQTWQQKGSPTGEQWGQQKGSSTGEQWSQQKGSSTGEQWGQQKGAAGEQMSQQKGGKPNSWQSQQSWGNAQAASGNQQNAWQQQSQWGNSTGSQMGKGWDGKSMAGLVQQQLQAQQNQNQGPQVLTVTTSGNDADEIVMRTLLGEYTENGDNHNRKSFKKNPVPGGDGVNVFIYYWDNRDGDAFEGWWFGNQVGGTQVWSQCKQSTVQPPATGWKIPWDGEVRPTLVVQPKATPAAVTPNVAPGGDMGNDAYGSDRAARAALEQAKAIAGDLTSAEDIQAAEDLLTPHITTLTSANKNLMERQKDATGDLANQMAAFAQKLRVTVAAVNSELGKLKATKAKVEKEGKEKALQEKDRTIFDDIIPEATGKTNAAEDAVEKATITAELIASGTDDVEEVRQAVDDTEKAARDAQTLIGEARIHLNAKLTVVKQRFETDAVRNEAMDILNQLQTQLQQAQAKLQPLKNVRQDFIQRAAAKKLTEEVKAKMLPAEVDVDRADELTMILVQEDHITKEMVIQADAAVTKAIDHLNATMEFLDSKRQKIPAEGIIRDELAKFEERAQAAMTKLQSMKTRQKDAQEKITVSTVSEEASEKLQAARDAVMKAADAEGPFLMGLEELPLEDTWIAVKACETAATSANTSVSIARMFIATKLVELKRASSAASKGAYAKLTELQKQLETLTKKLIDLKKASSERKTAALSRESEACVTKAEHLSKTVAESASCFEDDAKLMELSSDDVWNAGVETARAVEVACTAINAAKKFITERQIEAKGRENSEEVSALLIRYQTRLSTALSEVNRYKRMAASVEQRLAVKKIVDEANKKVSDAEESVKKACDVNAECEDATPEGIGEKAYADLVKQAETLAPEAFVALKQLDRYLSSQTRGSSSARDELRKLEPRVREAQKKMSACSAKIRERSEKSVVQGIIVESEKRVKEAEEASSQAMEAEVPFLSNKKLSTEESAAAFASLEAAAQSAHGIVGSTKTFLAMKRLAAKRLEETSAKSAIDELSKLQVRLDEASRKMNGIKKSIQERRSEQIKQEMVEKVSAVEKKVDAATEATKVLESIDAFANSSSAESAKAECEKIVSLEKEAAQMIDETIAFLEGKRQDATDLEEDFHDLQVRLTAAQNEIAKSKKALSDFEQRFVAQKLLVEASNMVANFEGEVAKLKQACAPLIEEGGLNFLAAAAVASIAEALTAHIHKTSSSKEQLFKEAGSVDGGPISKESLMAYLEKLPELLGKEDLALEEDEKSGVLECVDVDKDGKISAADFESIFALRYTCVQSISITDSFEIAKSKKVAQLQLGDVVVIVGEARVLPNGVTRVQCKTVEDGKAGWVTSKGNGGTVYLQLFSPYDAFEKATDRQIEAAKKVLGKTSSFIKAKTGALASSSQGPLADARDELVNLKPRVAVAEQELQGVKVMFQNARNSFTKKQESIKEAKNQRAAASLMKGIKVNVELMSDNAQKLADIAKPLLAASGIAELEEVATPLTISAEASKASEALMRDCVSVREGIAEQKEASAKAPKGPMREVKQELAKYMVKVDATQKKIESTADAIRKACATLAVGRASQVSVALRSTLQKKGVSLEAFFDQFAGGQSTMSGEAFLRCLSQLEGLSLPEEHVKLLVSHIGASDGISRYGFDRLGLQFYMCMKPIGITDDFSISKSKTLRMLELREIVEILEGPCSDEKVNLERVKGKALRDGKVGWISLKGNQGTPFLKEAHRPCYHCVTDLALRRDATGDTAVRTLKANEVVEVLEGPRKENFQGPSRGKGRACKDGAVGWFVTMAKDGTSNADRSGKFYICTASIAMTDARDIKKCKVLRKLAQDEVVSVLEAPTDAEDGGVQRVHCRSMKDQLEGWITIKGSKGTVFAEERSSLYTVVNETPLLDRFDADGATAVRNLEKGEAIELLEGPYEEKFNLTNFKGRAVSDGALGWVSVKADNVMLWSARYQCKAEVELRSLVKSDSELLCSVGESEILEALDGPREEGSELRIKVRRAKDNSVGWVTFKTAEGNVLLEHAPSSDS